MLLRNALLATAAAALLASSAQAATLANASFETGALSPEWTFTDGLVDVVTDADDASGDPLLGEHYTATDGTFFAELTAGDADVYTLLSQAFTLSAASRISFDAAFLAFDEAADNGAGFDYNDDAYVRIYAVGGPFNEVVFASDVLTVGAYGHTSWLHFVSSQLAAGDYIFEAGVRNATEGGPDYSSKLLIDNVGASVPEPATWALMLIGFGGLGAALRRRRLQAA